MKLIKKSEDTVTDVKEYKTLNNGRFELNDIASIEADDRRKRRWGWLVLLFGFGGFILWASFAPLDAGVPLNGTLKVTGDRKVVQHPSGGIIQSIDVKEGDLVEKGATLLTLNPIRIESQLESARTQWISVVSVQSRLRAELTDAKAITYPQWFVDNPDDQRVQDAISLQNQLFESRLAASASMKSSLRENVTALEAAVSDLRKGMTSKRAQLQSTNEQLEGIRKMAESGYLARNRLLEAEANQSRLLSSISDDTANLARVTGQLTEARLAMQRAEAEEKEKIQTQLTDSLRQAEQLRNEITALSFDADNNTVKSPIKGYVAGLQFSTIGGVIRPGEVIADVIPVGTAMEVDAQMPIQHIDRVTPGMNVDLMFTTLSATKTPEVPGVVKTVSADTLFDGNGNPYYLVQVTLPDNYLSYLHGHRVTAGMPVSAFVRSGERTMMSYLFKPLIDRMSFALTEK